MTLTFLTGHMSNVWPKLVKLCGKITGNHKLVLLGCWQTIFFSRLFFFLLKRGMRWSWQTDRSCTLECIGTLNVSPLVILSIHSTVQNYVRQSQDELFARNKILRIPGRIRNLVLVQYYVYWRISHRNLSFVLCVLLPVRCPNWGQFDSYGIFSLTRQGHVQVRR